MSDRFADVPRGRALRGARALAEYILGDPEETEVVFALPRPEFGLVMMGRDLTGWSGWIDFALLERARNAKGRRRSSQPREDAATTA